MIVMKFGGTSLGDAERIRTAAELVLREEKAGRKPLVVVSAHGKSKGRIKVTDLLLNAARGAVEGRIREPMEELRSRHYEILDALKLPRSIADKNLRELELLMTGVHLVGEISPRSLDIIASFGERLSCKCLAAHLKSLGYEHTEAINSYDLGFITDSAHQNATPLPDAPERIRHEYEKHQHKLVVTTGFIGKDLKGNITTLTRGGSDFSAAFFGAALDAEEIQIWTDVDGIMTADPSLVPQARPIRQMSFDEASEVAYFGAQVLHPWTVRPAVEKGIPVRVLNTFKPDEEGTMITREAPAAAPQVKCLVYKENIYLINVVSSRMLMAHGFMAKLFETFARHQVVIDMIATSEVSVSLTTDKALGLEALKQELEAPGPGGKPLARVDIATGRAIVCVVGAGLKHAVGLAARVFRAVADAGVNIQMISQGANEINIAFLVNNEDIKPAVKALHATFFNP